MSKSHFGLFLLVLLPACSSRSAQPRAAVKPSGGTYYVDSAFGSDLNPGTSPSSPWKTLARVDANTFLPGDTILLKSGSTWTGQIWPKGSGSEDLPIRIDKYGGDAKPSIQGAGQFEDAVLLKDQQYWEIGNLEITNTGTKSGKRRGVHVVNDNAGDLHHIHIHDLAIHDVNGVDSDKVNGGINYNVMGDSKPSRFIDLRIENNHVSHVDRSGIFGWSTHWARSKWYPSVGVVIRGNTLNDIGGDGIVVVATDGALVEHNVVSNVNQRSAGYNVAIWPWSADNTIIQYNEAYGTSGERDGEGFDSDWNSRNTVIQYNYSHDNAGGFMLICNEGGHKPEESAGNSGTVVRYNISQNDHHRGINIAGPVTNSSIYDNTIYIGKTDRVDLVLYSDWGGWPDSTLFYNNIFFVDGTAQISFARSRDANGHYVTAPGLGKSRSNTFDFNIYYGNLRSGDDPHGLMSDPLLVNPGGASLGRDSAVAYGLRPGSPAVDSGRLIPKSGGKDFFATSVPACGGVDRGAIELVRCSNTTSAGH